MENQSQRQDTYSQNVDTRNDTYNDTYNNTYYGGVHYGGTHYYTTVPCSATVISSGGVTYYSCGTTYYTKSYSGGSVVYVQTARPSGY